MVDALHLLELVDDVGQLLAVLHLHLHIDDGVAVGHTTGGDGRDFDLGGGQRHGDVQGQAVTILGADVQGGAVGGQLARCPGDLNPTCLLLWTAAVGVGVGAVLAVDGDAVATGDEAHNGVARDGGTALGELHQTAAHAVHQDAGVGGGGLWGIGDILSGAGGDDALGGGLCRRLCLLHLQSTQSTHLVLHSGHQLGEIEIGGVSPYHLRDKERAEFRRRKIGYIFQFFNLLPELTVYENICMPLYLDHRHPDKTFLRQIIEKLGLKKLLDKYPGELSGGEQQRVAVARALSSKPEIILADEPTGNLDKKTGDELMDLLLFSCRLFKQTILLVTHDLEIARMADRMITLEDGRVISDICGDSYEE